MNNMPLKLREVCAADEEYRTCMRQEALHDHECAPDPLNGRLIEWEHALIFAGEQVQRKFAVISSCWWAHRGPGLDKRKNVWIALNRASDTELEEISKATDYLVMRERLNEAYGAYEPARFRAICY